MPLANAISVQSRGTVHLLQFPSDAIKALILGANVPPKKSMEVRDRLARHPEWESLLVLQPQLSAECFAFDFEEVPPN